MGFINSVGGKYGVFQYQDPQDSTSGLNQSFGTGDSTTTAFQLVRSRGNFVEPVFAVDSIGSILVGSTVMGGGTYTVSNKGVVTFNTPPPNGQALQWNGTFNWFCRFDNDSIPFEQFTISPSQGGPLWGCKDVSFTSIKFGS